MPKQSDGIVLIFLVILLCVWLYYRFKRWLYAPFRIKLPFPEPSPVMRNEAVLLLEESGYQVISGRKKVPIHVELDDVQLDPHTRLFIDYFARKDNELYVVKLSKKRLVMEWSASRIREQFMNYHGLFQEAHGVLYVDLEEHRIYKVKFEIGSAE
jgi:hypothetical protein